MIKSNEFKAMDYVNFQSFKFNIGYQSLLWCHLIDVSWLRNFLFCFQLSGLQWKYGTYSFRLINLCDEFGERKPLEVSSVMFNIILRLGLQCFIFSFNACEVIFTMSELCSGLKLYGWLFWMLGKLQWVAKRMHVENCAKCVCF